MLIAIGSLDDGLFEVSYRDDFGRSGARAITDADAARFEVEGVFDSVCAYDADPGEFRLGAEALRVKYAAPYDPLVAGNSSVADPLPHQTHAVYEELLPRIPLRSLPADDPGAGKTIMAGLYLKELVLRSDCERAIIVAPGGLVEQWREEPSQKFDLHFEVFSRQMVDKAHGLNVFAEHPFLSVRMDQLSRSEDLTEHLGEVTWDVAVVDEAHRVSAHYPSWVGEADETERFKLGRLRSETAHNFLLMTPTPHAGKDENFQLSISLLIETERAQRQAEADRVAAIHEAAVSAATANGNSAGVGPVDVLWMGSVPSDEGEPSEAEPALEAGLARFFGSVKIDCDCCARATGNVTREVSDRLAGAGARLDITIDIQATKPGGFDESEVRTIGENARILEFDPSSGFEKR